MATLAEKAKKRIVPDEKTFNKYVPSIDRARNYTPQKAVSDAIAGLTVGLMLIPQALSYASLAGLPIQYGLYSSWAGLLVYMVFGTSNVIAVGPVAVVSLLLSGVVGKSPEKAAEIALLVGLVQILIGVTRLGVFVKFMSSAAIEGFTTASAITIISTQIGGLLGISTTVEGRPIPRTAIAGFYETFRNIKGAKFPDMLLSACVIIFLYAATAISRRKFTNPNVQKLATGLGIGRQVIAVLVCTGLTMAIPSLKAAISTSRSAPSGMPAPKFPHVDFSEFGKMIPESLEIGIIAFVEHYSMAQNFACKPGVESDVNPHQEFMALGVANAVGSIFHAFPITGSFSRTSVKYLAGVRTPFADIVTAGLIIGSMYLTSLFVYIPTAALGGVIVMSVYALIAYETLFHLFHVDKKEFLVMLLTIVVGLVSGELAFGVGAGVLLSLIYLLFDTVVPKKRKFTIYYMDGDKKARPYAVTYNFDSAIYFPSIGHLYKSVELVMNAGPIKCMIFDLGACAHIDFFAAEGMWKIQALCQAKKVHFCMVGARPMVLKKLEYTAPSSIDKTKFLFPDYLQVMSDHPSIFRIRTEKGKEFNGVGHVSEDEMIPVSLLRELPVGMREFATEQEIYWELQKQFSVAAQRAPEVGSSISSEVVEQMHQKTVSLAEQQEHEVLKLRWKIQEDAVRIQELEAEVYSLRQHPGYVPTTAPLTLTRSMAIGDAMPQTSVYPLAAPVPVTLTRSVARDDVASSSREDFLSARPALREEILSPFNYSPRVGVREDRTSPLFLPAVTNSPTLISEAQTAASLREENLMLLQEVDKLLKVDKMLSEKLQAAFPYSPNYSHPKSNRAFSSTPSTDRSETFLPPRKDLESSYNMESSAQLPLTSQK